MFIFFSDVNISNLRVMLAEAYERHADYVSQCEGRALIDECALVIALIEPILEYVDDHGPTISVSSSHPKLVM